VTAQPQSTSQQEGAPHPGGASVADLAELAQVVGEVKGAVERVISGKPDVIRTSLVVLLAEGHLLIEDVPGVG
jgi:MoxR-like ATPase